MTTIAWDGVSLASDGRGTSSGLARKVRKLYRLPDGGLFAISGDLAYGRAVYKYLCGKGPRPDKTPAAADCSAFMVVSPAGRASIIAGESLEPSPIYERCWAMGSGRDFALMAMHLGLSAEDAVRRTLKFDIFSGNGVCVMKPGK